jgi:hypothetical protein
MDEGKMRGGMFRHLSLTGPPSPPREERAEPRLLPANAVAPLRRPADAVSSSVAASRRSPPRLLVAPVDPLSDPRPASSAAQDPGVLRQIVLGCVAVVVIGGLGGAVLTLLGPRANDNLSAASPSAPAPQPPASSGAPAALSPATSSATATAAIPAVAPARQATPAEASVSATPSGLPATPPAHPARAPETSEATTPSGLPVPAEAPSGKAAAPTEKPVPPPRLATAAASDAGIPHTAAAQDFTASREPHTAAPRRPAHTHTALRHLRLHAANEKPSAEPPVDSAHPPRERPARRVATAASAGSARHPSEGAEAATSPQPAPDQASSFDELLTHLTGRAKTPDRPADRTSGVALTPPAPGAPDPFAPRSPDQ